MSLLSWIKAGVTTNWSGEEVIEKGELTNEGGENEFNKDSKSKLLIWSTKSSPKCEDWADCWNSLKLIEDIII